MVDEPQSTDTATPAPAAPAESVAPAPTEAPAARPSVLSVAEDVAPDAAPVADAPAAPDAPASVEYAITLPEGYEPNETVTAFTELAKTANIPVETAQKIMDMHIESQKHWQDGLEASRLEVFGEWYDKVKADPEIGGKNMAVVGKRVSALIKTNITGDTHRAEMDFLLKDMGLDSHPGFIRLMDNIAKKFAETPLGNDASTTPAAGFEPQKIWPGMNP